LTSAELEEKDATAVLVLGGSGAIGTAIRDRFTSAGHRVIATSTQDLDLSDPRSIKEWSTKPRPSIGTLLHAAGRNFPAPFTEMTTAEIERVFDVNVLGFLEVLRMVSDELIDNRGRIVLVSSIFGFLSRHSRLAYAMSKHALIGVMRTLAIEYAPKGVLVNAVSPGYIETPLTRQNNDVVTIDRLRRAVPVGRLGTAEEVAEAVYFLGSDRNTYINGHDLVVDGGFSIDGGRE
jgi:3-oxoacyl-[acyl-carrier protein] reductase